MKKVKILFCITYLTLITASDYAQNESPINSLEVKNIKKLTRNLHIEINKSLADLNIIKSFIDSGANVNNRNRDGETALIMAVINGNIEIIKLLIAAGADVNARDRHEQTALIRAAKKGYTEIVKLLLNAGANVYDKDIYGRTALIWAVPNGHREIVELLVAAGTVNISDKYGCTPLIFAAENGQTEIIKILLSAGANINARNNSKETALMLAAINYSTDTAMLLIDAGADCSDISPINLLVLKHPNLCLAATLAIFAGVGYKLWKTCQ
jgi:ankyrin repeat protein